MGFVLAISTVTAHRMPTAKLTAHQDRLRPPPFPIGKGLLGMMGVAPVGSVCALSTSVPESCRVIPTQ
jgi:hypothetical protein